MSGPVTLYRVDRAWGGPVCLVSVSATRRARTDKIEVSAGGFCRGEIVPIGTYADSIEEAVTRFQTGKLAQIERWRRDIAEAEADIEASRALEEG